MLTIESLAGNPLRLVAPGRLARVVSMAIGLLNVLVDFGIDRVFPFKESVESEQLDTRWRLPSALSDCEGLRKGRSFSDVAAVPQNAGTPDKSLSHESSRLNGPQLQERSCTANDHKIARREAIPTKCKCQQ